MTVEHVAGIAVRNATIVEVSRHQGLTIATCEPADPLSDGGSEATVKIAKADIMPTDHNLRDEYADWQALEQACREFMADWSWSTTRWRGAQVTAGSLTGTRPASSLTSSQRP